MLAWYPCGATAFLPTLLPSLFPFFAIQKVNATGRAGSPKRQGTDMFELPYVSLTPRGFLEAMSRSRHFSPLEQYRLPVTLKNQKTWQDGLRIPRESNDRMRQGPLVPQLPYSPLFVNCSLLPWTEVGEGCRTNTRAQSLFQDLLLPQFFSGKSHSKAKGLLFQLTSNRLH